MTDQKGYLAVESAKPDVSPPWSIDSWRKFWSHPSPAVAFDRVPTIVAPDVVAIWPRCTRPVRGPDEYAQRAADILTLVPDLRLELVEHATNGDIVFIRWIARGTGPDGPFEGIGADRIKVRDGRVVENLILSDLEIFATLSQFVEVERDDAGAHPSPRPPLSPPLHSIRFAFPWLRLRGRPALDEIANEELRLTTTVASPPTTTTSWRTRISWTLLAILCLGVAAYSARYLLHPPETPAQALDNSLGVPWLFIHVAGAVTALVPGSLQFLPALRRGKGRAIGSPHRWTGRVYVAGCLVGGATGLILAPGSYAGPIASAGFGSLAIIWITVTLLGWRAAVQGRFIEHRRWMIRSWALTLAAVTLRLYLPLVMVLDLPFLPWYRAISFLAWLPNLIAAELWLRRRERPNLTSPSWRSVARDTDAAENRERPAAGRRPR